ncbi:MAG TPA: AMP-binding protein [Candidatus Thermoplasmatota archaeon]|nr:AMP-binding protein [Candidatus Thermoplasmatota archaeon]
MARTLPRLLDEQDPRAPALVFEATEGRQTRLLFGDVQALSRRAAAWLLAQGVLPGDRVATVLPQHPVAPIVHLAALRVGAMAVPLSPLFGPDGLGTRLADAAPALIVADAQRKDVVGQAIGSRSRRPVLATVSSHESFFASLPSEGRLPEDPRDADAPAFLLYTSGTTAVPKGALLPHRVIDGRLPALRLVHDPLPAEGDLFWSPADWSWIGGLHDALLAPWALGVPVFAYGRRSRFDAAEACARIARAGVRNAFLPPTALRAFLAQGGEPPPLRSLHTAGEPLPEAVRREASARWNLSPVEVYGLTECAFLVGGAARAWTRRAGCTGKAYPGHDVRVIAEDGARCAPGEEGELAVAAPDPTLMLGYWRGPDRPPILPLAEGLLRTGDLARADEDGYLRVLGRRDDVIKSAGYRIGPAEVESILLAHPSVAECAVVGLPDETRGQAVAAYVVPRNGSGSADLQQALCDLVRERLGAHARPQRVEFVAELPRTATGKLRRAALRDQASSRRETADDRRAS